MKLTLLKDVHDGDEFGNEYRHPYMRDEARVIHSFAFRRLQGKTQKKELFVTI